MSADANAHSTYGSLRRNGLVYLLVSSAHAQCEGGASAYSATTAGGEAHGVRAGHAE